MSLYSDILQRRTIRKYSSRKVDDKLLYSLLEAAGRTQTMGNLQLYSFIVTRDIEKKKELAKAHYGQPMVEGAPVMLTICADYNRTTQWCNNRNALPGYDNLLSLANAASDALLYTQTISLLSEENGLGVCYLGTVLYQPELIIEALKLPKLVMPVAVLTVGWPAETPNQSDRLPLESFVHSEIYHNYTPQDIDKYYTPKETLPENINFVQINNCETLAQVYAEKRYTKADNIALSENLQKVLLQQGFM